MRPRSTGDVVAGLIFLALGVAFAVGSLGYELGELLDMGPGYLPLVLGLALAALGLACVVKAYVAPDPVPDAGPAGPGGQGAPSVVVPGDGAPAGARDAVPSDDAPDPRPLAGLEWRPVLAIAAAIVFFALTIDGLGLILATFGAVLLSSLARGGVPWLRVVITSVALTALCWVVFVLALQLRLSLFGDWLGG
ncbi:tripartite tricarboxylate transporter TctB family protein [Myceligenerans crystallogenes]|uniref:DUF1468 domain-containing protein n=1 Tax=Myceligenerans crystallogenes TaxID=316335 RepID=A0ABN2NQ40_9MICO